MIRTHPIHLLLADDQRLVRAGVRGLLQDVANIQFVGEAASGEEACRIAVNLGRQVIVMDISLPRVRGIETIGRLPYSNQPPGSSAFASCGATKTGSTLPPP